MYFKSVTIVVLFLITGMSSAATGIQKNRLEGAVSVQADRETLRCMQCHDGVSARDVEITFPGTETGMSSLHSGKHPIGMRYLDYVLATPLEYRSQGGLNTDIQLVEGKVSCVSCHRIRQQSSLSTLSSHMVQNEDTVCLSSSDPKKGLGQTELCQSCHIK